MVFMNTTNNTATETVTRTIKIVDRSGSVVDYRVYRGTIEQISQWMQAWWFEVSDTGDQLVIE